ncbi:hypothetical protein A0257_12465 [Hymenobacter psoromatis]|nr:hypothetical protein A0257_12465 [Hymenobacter psoromatis]
MQLKSRNSFILSRLWHIRLTVKTKIWMTITTIVLLFSFFVLFYVPAIQERNLLANFNKEVQNYANTVALGVKIAMTEQNFQGVQTAMDFVKKDPLLKFVSLIQTDTIWNNKRTKYQIVETIFKTYPEREKININYLSNDSTVVKRADFSTPMMRGKVLLAFSTKEIIQSKRQIRGTSLFFSFLFFSIGILTCFDLARNISVPILKLRDAATRVGRGDLTQRVFSKSRDEIGELGIVFNMMVADLAMARKDLENRTTELILEKKKTDELLEGLHKTLADLKNTQEQLIRQEKFASIGQLTKGLVDRLLNPLSYITNFSALSNELLGESKEALAFDKYSSDEHIQTELIPLLTIIENNIEKIKEHGSSLTRIVRSMDKLLQGKNSVFVKSDINAFIEAQLGIYQNEVDASYKGTPLELKKGSNINNYSVKILPTEMSFVLFNIINNSMYALLEKSSKNRDFKPWLTVETSFYEEHVEICVRDNGTGISAVERSQLFSPFFTTKPTSKGTGLGLFISQDIVKAHKGNITVETIPEIYTAFTITLPVSAAPIT